MDAEQLLDERNDFSDTMFVEMVVWKVPQPIRGSLHFYKYRLAFVVEDRCVLRYDNEKGKGDHKHFGRREEPYHFVDVPTLLADFRKDVDQWRSRS